jgi:hypothetical protein
MEGEKTIAYADEVEDVSEKKDKSKVALKRHKSIPVEPDHFRPGDKVQVQVVVTERAHND